MKRIPLLLCFVVLFSVKVAIAETKSVLPKTGPTTKVLILDAGLTKAHGLGPSKFESISSAAMQGLINRNANEKIYIKNWHTRIFQQPESGDLKLGGGKGDAYAMMLDLIPFPKQEVQLDASLKYPVITHLVKNYRHLLNGAVLVPTGWGPDIEGAVAAGFNACAFDSLLPVTREVYGLLRSQGLPLPIVHDLSEMDNVEAFRWSMERYLDHPKRYRRVVGYTGSYYDMADYWVANYVYCWSLHNNHKKPAAQHLLKQHELVPELLNEKNFVLGSPVIGDSEGPRMITEIVTAGFHVVCGNVGNCSVTSSIPVSEDMFEPAPEPKAFPVDGETCYISFSGNDGDAIDFGMYCAFKNFVTDPCAGKVAMSWKLNPYFIDLFPTFAAFHFGHYENVDVAGSMNDGGMPGDVGDARAEWLRQYRYYVDKTNGAINQFCYLGPFNGFHSIEETFQSLGARYVYRGYDSRPYQAWPLWARDDKCVVSNLTGLAGATPHQTAAEVAKAINENAAPDRPQFAMVRLGIDNARDLNARRGTIPFSMAQEVKDSLASMNLKREVVYLIPRDLAETYRVWANAASIANDKTPQRKGLAK